jgi:hypothetical protein
MPQFLKLPELSMEVYTKLRNYYHFLNFKIFKCWFGIVKELAEICFFINFATRYN